MNDGLEPEWLDSLPASDPKADRSRRDLRLLNVLMGNAGHLAAAARRALGGRARSEVVDLGAGDGTLMLRLARRLGPGWRDIEVVLVDRRGIVSAATRHRFERMSWRVRTVEADVLEWLDQPFERRASLMAANLFLHHFNRTSLRRLLELASRRTDCFIACEPRRERLALGASRCLGLLGCNAVTRHDAVLSVRAGFTAKELSALWPANGDWASQEGPAGWFSHCFVARRRVLGPTQRAGEGGY